MRVPRAPYRLQLGPARSLRERRVGPGKPGREGLPDACLSVVARLGRVFVGVRAFLAGSLPRGACVALDRTGAEPAMRVLYFGLRP